MAASQEQPPNPAAPPVASPCTFWADLKTDAKTVMNQAAWNFGLLVPCYMYDLDRKVFSENDSDIVAAAKLAGVVSGMSEGTKLLRKTLVQAGVSPKVTHPFGVPGAT